MNTQQDSNRVDLHALAREARRMPTPAEKVLWEMVRDHCCGGLHFRRQAIIGPFRVDFYCPAACLAVEVDGSVHQEPAVQKRDADRQAIIEQEFGLRFLRLRNEDVLERPQETLKTAERREGHRNDRDPPDGAGGRLRGPQATGRPMLARRDRVGLSLSY